MEYLAILLSVFLAFVAGVLVNSFWEWLKKPRLVIGLYSNPSPAGVQPKWKQIGIELKIVRKRPWGPLTPNAVFGCWGEYEVTAPSSSAFFGQKRQTLWNAEVCTFDGKSGRQTLKRYQVNLYQGTNIELTRAVIAAKTEGEDGFYFLSDREEPVSNKSVQVVTTLHYGESDVVSKCATINNPNAHCASFAWSEAQS